MQYPLWLLGVVQQDDSDADPGYTTNTLGSGRWNCGYTLCVGLTTWKPIHVGGELKFYSFNLQN